MLLHRLHQLKKSLNICRTVNRNTSAVAADASSCCFSDQLNLVTFGRQKKTLQKRLDPYWSRPLVLGSPGTHVKTLLLSEAPQGGK